MKLPLACVVFLLCACGILAGQSASPSALIIHDVTVIDATGGPAQAHRTVIVRDGKIEEIGNSDAGKGGKLPGIHVDGGGKFLIPGLWDMHVHMVFGDWFPTARKSRCRCSSPTALLACGIWVGNWRYCSNGGKKSLPGR